MIGANENFPTLVTNYVQAVNFLFGHFAVQRLRCFSPQDLKDLDELSSPLTPR
jgi:hypothetical protein